MKLTRYDAMFFACAVAAWFIIDVTAGWQIVALAILFVLMAISGELKEAQRRKRLTRDTAA